MADLSVNFVKSVLYCVCQFPLLLTALQLEGNELNEMVGRDEDCHYTAAVFEHSSVSSLTPFITRSEARAVMNINLDMFEKQVKQASLEGAKVIVFPEYGVTGFFRSPTRESIQSFLEVAPNTTEPSVNPCTQEEYDDRPIQRRISCMAKQYSIIIVVSMATIQPCTNTDPHCPADGRYQFSTALAYGVDGTLLAIYHKTNLYTEELRIFDAGSKITIAEGVFKTEFGTFSLLICFDILFDYPAREFAEFGVDTAIFPTAWMNELPLLSAAEYQQAWALGMGMNLLGANQHFPLEQMTGSGLFAASEGAIDYYYNMSTQEGKLLVGDLPCFPSKTLRRRMTNSDSNNAHSVPQPKAKYMNFLGATYDSSAVSRLDGNSLKAKLVTEVTNKINNVTCGMNHGNDFQRDDKTFISLVNDDPYTLRLLTKAQDKFTLTDHDVSCTLSYTLNDTWGGVDWYAFGAFDGLHTVNGQYYVHACVLLRCAGPQKSLCGTETDHAHTTFHDLSVRISGYAPGKTFLTPEILTNGVGLPRRRHTWDTNDHLDRIWSRGGKFKDPLLMAGIYGRLYARD